MLLRPILLCIALLAAGCDLARDAGAEPPPRRLVLTGSSTVAPLAREIGRRFEREHRGVRVEVQTGGSSRGIRDARGGAADIGMASRALTAAEAAQLDAHLVARDEIAVLVHADNRAPDLSVAALRDIYAGRIDDWSEVGGVAGPIIVSDRAAGRSEPTLVYDRLRIAPTRVRADVVDGETQQAIKTVTANPAAITWSG